MRVTLLILVLALAAAGCGFGPATNEEQISKTASTYLRALADADTATACAQLTARARNQACDQAMKKRLNRLDPDVLKAVADNSMDIEVDGNRASVGLSQPRGARFLLVKTNDEWRIDSGYTLTRDTLVSTLPARGRSRPAAVSPTVIAPALCRRPRGVALFMDARR
jgi:hypothetical protein